MNHRDRLTEKVRETGEGEGDKQTARQTHLPQRGGDQYKVASHCCSTAHLCFELRLWQYGITPLHTVSALNQLEAVDLLITARADVNCKNNVGPSILWLWCPT